MRFKKVDAKVDFPKLERRILKDWEKRGILKKYLCKNLNVKERFGFLDGPITANNPMGVHHAWGRSYKDLFQRYKNMQGFRQRFQNGFDAQGLWVEVEVEKELGFKSKKDIEKYGIGKFVKRCKERVFKYAKIQTKQSKRLGYFMDWDKGSYFRGTAKETRLANKVRGSYYTLSDENNYTIWYFLKKCHERGWIYEGKDVVPWCPRCGTAISEHEIVTEGYRELTHKGLFLKFPVTGKPKTYFLVWTTTPWTLPANTTLAVGDETAYVTVQQGDELFILADGREVAAGIAGKVQEKVGGKEFAGLAYMGPFDDLPIQEGVTHRVVLADFVATEEGTGVVHLAPGSGKEDFQLAKERDLPVIESLDEEGKYLQGFGKYSGRRATEVEEEIIKDLKERGFLYKVEDYTHRYPVCWRCGTELLFRLVDEWYIEMDELREPVKKVVQSINWIPSWGLERELDWLENMGDWLISKKRYWGLALPFYKCKKCNTFEVIGSKEELKERAISGWKEFEGHSPHRPWVDKVKIACLKCGEPVSRIPDVGNPWLDAGIVSFSTLIDPQTKKVSYLTDKKYWREWFPFDFITESFPGQFRNWFYSLLAMATVLEGRVPFKNVLGHALVRDEIGREMHKSWGNAIDFDEGVERMGADIMRWMYFTHDPETNINFGYGPADVIRRRFFLILWNCYKFFVDYANVDRFNPAKELDPKGKKFTFESYKHSVLDRWILSRLNVLVKEVGEALDRFDVMTATFAIEEFVVRDLSQWYIRRSRDRVGPTTPGGEDKRAAYVTLYRVLFTLSKLLAPFTPFIADEVYRNLAQGQKGYQGGRGTVTGAEASVHLVSWPDYHDYLIDQKLLGDMLLVREIVEKGHSFRKARKLSLRQPLPELIVKGFPGFRSNYQKGLCALIADELNVKTVTLKEGKGKLIVEFDTRLTDELQAEGRARELIREIQDLRKEKKLEFDDRIEVVYPEAVENKSAVAKAGEFIRQQTLATSLKPGRKLMIRQVKPT
ncbi:isoleucine--tRNA ligase [candidate division WWE3 bacterium CG_4_9_14_0_2_um_filter_48_10]|uniref:Isoleucine--tRNA ligase n=1 Tax=candidate division WWE3 bacterium CG_4_9_14_0_2_um_filter_48_10 TaxID=1975078 RepID=A0A2M8EJC1_UNCKA|nr:MAG: isoleucine--tRNA ligase [candidate division WWE3 bacterium CG_4_9_14_0_2_um_filter_48_10]